VSGQVPVTGSAGPVLRVLTLSDFNADNFRSIMAHATGGLALESVPASFGQVESLLLDEEAECWSPAPDCLVVWTRPHGVIRQFEEALAFEPFDVDGVLSEVDVFASLLTSVVGRVRTLLVPTWTLPGHERGLGVLDHRRGLGLADLLARMNQRLSERLADVPGAFLLDSLRWLQAAGPRGYNPKAWYMGRMAFGNEVFVAAAADVRAALRAVAGMARKLVVVDLDETLWGGVVGDVGWEGLVLGGHDPEGEALADFQKGLKALTNRGVLLGIVSKNTEEVALEAIRNHPEMVLGLDDFAGWRIDWSDKAQNLADLVEDLNLGLQSVVFIDDNPAERARVREALPEVFVPDWPSDKSQYRVALSRLDCFDTVVVTEEDRQRTTLYVEERHRRAGHRQVGSLDEWLGTLDIRISVELLNGANLARAAQLLNKTNQMNLSTRRMTESELMEWASRSGHHSWTLRASDRFGDLGIVGLLSIEDGRETFRVVDFVLSCRAMGRKVEETMLALAIRHGGESGVQTVDARYLPTAKNLPCETFLNRSGALRGGEPNLYQWKTDRAYTFPPQVTVITDEETSP